MINFSRGTIILFLSIACLCGGIGGSASAATKITINDPRTLEYAVQGDRVYLRNLNHYDSTWLGCCYHYYIDLTSDGGKARFSTLLSYVMSGQTFFIYKDDPVLPGDINIVGYF